MTREMWINLPVKDINESKAFFTTLGFSFDPKHSNSELVCLVIGEKNVAVNLFKESTFETLRKIKSQEQSMLQKYCFPLEQKAEMK